MRRPSGNRPAFDRFLDGSGMKRGEFLKACMGGAAGLESKISSPTKISGEIPGGGESAGQAASVLSVGFRFLVRQRSSEVRCRTR